MRQGVKFLVGLIPQVQYTIFLSSLSKLRQSGIATSLRILLTFYGFFI